VLLALVCHCLLTKSLAVPLHVYVLLYTHTSTPPALQSRFTHLGSSLLPAGFTHPQVHPVEPGLESYRQVFPSQRAAAPGDDQVASRALPPPSWKQTGLRLAAALKTGAWLGLRPGWAATIVPQMQECILEPITQTDLTN